MLRWLASMSIAPATPAAAQTDRIDQHFAGHMALENIPGAVLVVLRGDEVAIARAWGMADRATAAPMRVDAVQPVHSIGKQFTAALVLRPVDGRPEFDWMEHRSYLVRRAPQPATPE